MFGPNDSPVVRTHKQSLRQCNVPHEVFAGSEANRRYPDQLKLPDSYACVFERDGGILRANKAVAALQVSRYLSLSSISVFLPQELFVSHGGVLQDNHRVTRIIPGPVVTVETDKTSFRAKRIIVTAGAWTNKLLQHTGLTLPLKVYPTCIVLLPSNYSTAGV